MKIVVFHKSYGCDTGCCGHVVQSDDDDEDFEFTHPYGADHLDFAKGLVTQLYGEDHVDDLVWEECIISDD